MNGNTTILGTDKLKGGLAAYRHFQDAANQHGDAAVAISITATGLHVLTGVIEELLHEVKTLRGEVNALREGC